MSLRLRLVLALVLVNAAVLGTLAWWTAEREQVREGIELESISHEAVRQALKKTNLSLGARSSG